MSAGFITLDASWRIRYVNQEGQRLLGRTGDEIVDRVLWEVFPETVGADFERHYRQVWHTGRPVSFDAYYPEPLNAWYQIRAWIDPDRTALSLCFLDVTARHATEQETRRDAERSHMLAYLSEALAGMTDQHEAVRRLATLAVPTLADWCVVTLAGSAEPGWAHRDPGRLGDVQWYAEAAVDRTDPDTPLWTMMTAGTPFHLPQAAPATVERIFPDPAVRQLLDRLLPTSATVVPLTAGGHTLGVLELWNTGTRAAHTAPEIDTALEMGRRAGLAVGNAQLQARQRRMSETLQRSMLTAPVRTPHVELAVRYHPAAQEAQIGGDWYDAFRTGAGMTCLAIGDVAGHDRDAAAAMGQVRGLLRGIAHVLDGRPERVLAALDRAMWDLGVAALATTVLATIEPVGQAPAPGTHRLRWSNAGHPPPLLIEPDGSASLLRPKVDLLLGADRGATRASHELLLCPGTTVLLYTDGLIERRAATIDDGLDWLVKAAGEFTGCTLDDVCDGLLNDIGPDVEDDVAMLGIRIGADAAPTPVQPYGPNATCPGSAQA